jgi:kinetochore protein NDC80
MGIDYKSKLQPALNSYADDIQKSSMEKLEELISLQQQSKEKAAKIEEKRNNVAELQSCIDEVSASGLGLCTMILISGFYTLSTYYVL